MKIINSLERRKIIKIRKSELHKERKILYYRRNNEVNLKK